MTLSCCFISRHHQSVKKLIGFSKAAHPSPRLLTERPQVSNSSSHKRSGILRPKRLSSRAMQRTCGHHPCFDPISVTDLGPFRWRPPSRRQPHLINISLTFEPKPSLVSALVTLTKTRQGTVRLTWLEEDVLCDDLEPLSPETSGRAMPRGFRFPQLLRRELVMSKLWVSCTRHVQEVKARPFFPGARMSPTWHRACVKHTASRKSGLKSSIRRGVVSRVAGARVEGIGADRSK
jgi:hypothetical protein